LTQTLSAATSAMIVARTTRIQGSQRRQASERIAFPLARLAAARADAGLDERAAGDASVLRAQAEDAVADSESRHHYADRDREAEEGSRVSGDGMHSRTSKPRASHLFIVRSG
jgi:hypothetical protein